MYSPFIYHRHSALGTHQLSERKKMSPAHAMLFAGFSLGLGMLAKYAAIYGLFGLILIWALGRNQTAPVISGKHLLFAFCTFLITLSPNLIWNVINDFSTVRHLGENANLTKSTNNLGESLTFLLSQAGVAGPLTFLLMIGIFVRIT